MLQTQLLIEVFVTLFVIMDPIGTVPIFLALTKDHTRKKINSAAWQAVLVSFLVITVFAFFGQQILNYLGISLPALQGAGGLLLLLVALELLTGKDQHDTGQTAENVALVPLGTPLLAGPGAIVATMVFSRQVDSSGTFWAVALGVVLVHLALWLAMRFAVPVLQILGNSGVLLLTKIAGILLSAIAIQMIANSIKAFIAVG